MKLSLTVDVEEFYHLLELPNGVPRERGRSYSSVKRVIPTLLDVLDEFSVTALFFWVGSVADENASLVRLVRDRGHEIGSHSYSHQCMHELTDLQFKADLARSISALQDIIGDDISCYRAPGFSVTDSYFYRYNEIARAGVTFDYSLFSGNASHGGVLLPKSSTSVKFPVEPGSIYSFPFIASSIGFFHAPLFGGGYFRLAPEIILNRATRKPGIQMVYLHPRDFDLGQPRISDLGFSRRFKAYTGIGTTWAKLIKLLNTCSWISPAEYRMEALHACVDI